MLGDHSLLWDDEHGASVRPVPVEELLELCFAPLPDAEPLARDQVLGAVRELVDAGICGVAEEAVQILVGPELLAEINAAGGVVNGELV